jgi:hypothetical protein
MPQPTTAPSERPVESPSGGEYLSTILRGVSLLLGAGVSSGIAIWELVFGDLMVAYVRSNQIEPATRKLLFLFGGSQDLFSAVAVSGTASLYLAPVVIACALPTTTWTPPITSLGAADLAAVAGIAALSALAIEGWFRGLVHGWFLFHGPLQRVAGPWFVSRASMASALFYMLTSLLVSLSWHVSEADPFPHRPLDLAIFAIAGLAGGAALGMIRERSLSLWPGVLLQFIGGLLGAGLALSSF